MHIIVMPPDQLEAAAAFVARLQADPAHHIAYFGLTEAEISAAMVEFEPQDGQRVLLAIENDVIVGLLGMDSSTEVKRAWLHGPLIAAGDWDATADALYIETITRNIIPPSMVEHELFVDAANTRVRSFAGRQGFRTLTLEASLRLGRETFVGAGFVADESISELTTEQHTAFAHLHEVTFPNPYFSSREIIDNMGERDKVFVATQAGEVVGYIYAKIEPEATNGYIDFLGVAEAARRQGIGKRLIAHAVRWLFTFPEIDEVTLTVNGQNAGAVALYTGLGFEHLRSMQGYRKKIER